MQHAAAMDVVNCFGDGLRNPGDDMGTDSALTRQVRQGSSLDKLHRKIRNPVVFTDFMNRDQIRMSQPRRSLRFVLKPPSDFRRTKLPLLNHLQSHNAPQRTLVMPCRQCPFRRDRQSRESRNHQSGRLASPQVRRMRQQSGRCESDCSETQAAQSYSRDIVPAIHPHPAYHAEQGTLQERLPVGRHVRIFDRFMRVIMMGGPFRFCLQRSEYSKEAHWNPFQAEAVSIPDE